MMQSSDVMCVLKLYCLTMKLTDVVIGGSDECDYEEFSHLNPNNCMKMVLIFQVFTIDLVMSTIEQ